MSRTSAAIYGCRDSLVEAVHNGVWVAECWPDKLGLVAIDGKTSRRVELRMSRILWMLDTQHAKLQKRYGAEDVNG